jgi:hypothetical protein
MRFANAGFCDSFPPGGSGLPSKNKFLAAAA